MRRAWPSSMAALALLTLLGACGDDPERLAGDGDTLVQLEDPTTTAVPTATSPVTSESSETQGRATTTTAEIEPVAGCVDFLTFQIEAGDEDAVDLWEELGETTDALRDECERLAVEDPARVEDMIEQKRAIDAYLAGAAAAETTSPETTD